MWVRHAKYDQPNTSDFAGQTFTVTIHNPKGEKVYSTRTWSPTSLRRRFRRPVPAQGHDARRLQPHPDKPSDPTVQGDSHFRVEEYKKPEFEVKVEAPKEPVKLGEKITATIEAKYYFGAPVTQRQGQVQGACAPAYSAQWYPHGDWDWFYGNGYWWFACDYSWYPGLDRVGLHAGRCRWWWGRRHQPPEVVLENEVRDRPRRQREGLDRHARRPRSCTAIRTTSTRSPPRWSTSRGAPSSAAATCWWPASRSRSTPGSTAATTAPATPSRRFFNAQTLDQKPVQGKGELTLFKITYDAKSQPVEKVVETWKLDTDAEGKAWQQIKAAHAGPVSSRRTR